MTFGTEFKWAQINGSDVFPRLSRKLNIEWCNQALSVWKLFSAKHHSKCHYSSGRGNSVPTDPVTQRGCLFYVLDGLQPLATTVRDYGSLSNNEKHSLACIMCLLVLFIEGQ